MPHLGLAIYRWGGRSQDHLLKNWLGPTVAELKKEKTIRAFWFDRFDARGPHLTIVLTLTQTGITETAERVSSSLESYLADFPSTESLNLDEVTKLHSACRGRMQCEADRLPGLAENNTFLVYEHPPWDFPFSLSQNIEGEEELWDLVDQVSEHSIAELAAELPAPVREAVRWVAAVDLALRNAGFDAVSYWRYHASTLLLPLQQRLATEEERVLADLPSWIGEANRKRFESIFNEMATPDKAGLQQRLIEIAGSRDDSLLGGRWALLREIDHSKLKQLGLGVALHIPLILFAWNRSLKCNPYLASIPPHPLLQGSTV